ncbi:Structural maintenance of chromosomes protein 5 [Gurleya vavrai]
MHSDTQNVEREYERLIQAKIQPTMIINIAQEELRQIERHLEDVKSRRNVAKRTLQDEKRKIENFENENLKIYDTMIAESQKNILKNSVSIINDFSNDEDLSFENNENFDTNNLIARSEKYILGSYIEELKKLPEDIQNLRQEYSNEKLALTTYDCDLKAIELYKIKSKSLNEMDKEIGLLNKGIASNENKLKKIKNEVIDKIKNLLLPVNKRFSYFFEKMNCEGKIDFVYEDLDYHKWKINILVRFREQEGLMQLSSGRQSGGEKSVSTILFLLALQNLSVSPFKLVDEINQGMDRNNERMISNLLIKISEEEDSPQFFIITPKIVSGIEFGERMKIIIIYGCENGMQQKFANYNSSLMI